MSKTVNLTQAKAKLSELVNWATQNDDQVIIQKRGKATAAIVPIEYVELIKAEIEQRKRARAIKKLQRIAKQVQARNADLTSEQAEELADKFTREVIDDMVAEGKITFAE